MNLPEILSSPNIPKPLHGLNPRGIMGRDACDAVRKDVYASTDFHCAACGVHKSKAQKHRWLEAHETYEIDYPKGIATLTEIVPLCHYCHNFIHSGRLRMMARAREVTANDVREIMRHGVDVLAAINSPIFAGTKVLCDLVSVDTKGLREMSPPARMAPWGAWVMKWNGKEYRGKFKTMEAWQRAYA